VHTDTQAWSVTERPPKIEDTVREYGDRIFSLIASAEAPSLFSARRMYGALMDWAMKDEKFKVQLFRFVDVLPALTSPSEIARHLTEYLDNDQVNLAAPLRAAIRATNLAGLFGGGLFSSGVKSQVAGMARMFMLGSDPKEIVSILRRLHDQGTAFTVDLPGETVVSELEADEYVRRYMDLISLLHPISREQD